MGLNTMDIFGSVEHNDDNSDKWPALPDNPTSNDLLDYMVMIIARELESEKAFKGGYMMNQLLGGYSRMTHDVDFSIMNEKAYSEVKDKLENISEHFKKLNLISEYKIKESITPTSSGGVDMYDNTGKKILGVDVGLHNILYGTREYNIKVGDVIGFKVERMLSDKILAILSRKRFRRTKDLYDLYILANRYDFSYDELVYCIEHRDNYDASVWENIPFSDTVLTEYSKAWDKLNLVSYSTGGTLIKPAFLECIQIFNTIAFGVKNSVGAKTWDHKLLSWRF